MPSTPATRQAAALPTPPATGRPAKHRDFKPELARATPAATPGPPRPAAQPAIARAPAAAVPVIARATIAPSAAEVALRPWEARGNAEFRQRIAEAERSAEHPQDGYGLRNPASGALGRYQFVSVALRDIGWIDAEGVWTATAARHGVTDDAGFLASPAAQEAALSDYLARQETILDRGGTLGSAGVTITALDGSAITLTEGAMVAAAHRRGAGMLARYLAHRRDTPDAPITPAQRAAFESVEHRLRGFAQVAYVSERPGNRMMARRGGPSA